ncbi:MAG: hypothetical protein CM1200mP9_11480 [Gammaproteobacteria bacterium]|nr:MAG: hypothetical protein CM1200mP9_11480 [Gammaproteobacteria bacterium]
MVDGWWVGGNASGGHYATNQTHIDDFVESTRMLTPKGWFESRRLPGSGAGPSPDRLVIGSEGTLGLISECWLRLQKRPIYRATAGVTFSSWGAGADAVRHVVQTKLWPANLRILDPLEAANAAGMDGDSALLIIGFESGDVPQGENIWAAINIAREFGGVVDDDDVRIDDGGGGTTGRQGAVGPWRDAFIGVNAGLTAGLGLLSDTFETAITWDKWPEFDGEVRERVGRALRETLGEDAQLSCRFTHVYADGPAPYYSFSGPVEIGGSWNLGKSSKMQLWMRSLTQVVRSPITMPSAVCIATVGKGSDQSFLVRFFVRLNIRSILTGYSIRVFSSILNLERCFCPRKPRA